MDSNGLIQALTRAMAEENGVDLPPMQKQPSSLSAATLEMKMSRVPKSEKVARLTYPYAPLDHDKAAYRGYPIEGTKYFKKNKQWKIQLVNPACGAPTAPLPQFPQQELLVNRKKGGYMGAPARRLSEKETLNNSGEAWHDGKERPRSEYFYTAGYRDGAAVKLQKPYTESFYRSLISGEPVPVRVIKGGGN